MTTFRIEEQFNNDFGFVYAKVLLLQNKKVVGVQYYQYTDKSLTEWEEIPKQ